MSVAPDPPDDPPTGPQRPPGGRPRNAGAVEAAVIALAAGATVPDAARTAGVSLKTLKRWRRDQRFRDRVEERRREILTEATAKLTGSMTKAADKLGTLIDSADEKVALAASKSTLELGLKVREQLEIAERLAALEAATGDKR